MIKEYLFLGLIQGIFEWLPVSSEGVVAVAAHLLHLEVNPVDIGLFLHLGTAFSVLFYFRKEWIEIVSFRNKKLLRFILVVSGISLVVGLPIYHVIRQVTAGNFLFFITGFALLLTAYFHKRRPDVKLGWDETAILTGLLQALSVIPGISRSGSTMFGLAWGEDIENPTQILKLSYLVSLPVIFASSAYLFLFIPQQGLMNAWPALLVSFITSLFTLHLLLKLVRRINFFWFVLALSALSFMGGFLLL